VRSYFSSLLEQAMRSDDRIVLLYGDIGNTLFDRIRKDFPGRAVNCGVAEANMVSVAAGMAKSGLLPVVYTISSFLYLKALEQIKLDVAYGKNRIILVGTGGGLSYSALGATHHSLEDIAVLNSIPDLAIYAPSDFFELSAAFSAALSDSVSSWIRLGKKEEIWHEANTGAEQGFLLEPHLVSTEPGTGTDKCFANFLASGVVVKECIAAAELLRLRGLSVNVWSIPRLKPWVGVDAIQSMLACENLFIVEEHSEKGGLFSLIVSSLVNLADTPEVFHVSTGDSFHSGLGDSDQARHSLALNREALVNLVNSKLV